MKIQDIQIHVVRIPLTSPYVISRGALTDFTNVVVELTTESGISGFGEAVPVSIIGDPLLYAAVIRMHLAPRLLGRDCADVATIVDDMLLHCQGHVGAVAAIDLALWDILGQSQDVPVWKLFADTSDRQVRIDYTLSVDTPMRMAERAHLMTTGGYGGVVVKVPCRYIGEDVARVRAVRRAIAPAASLRVDCNGGYKREDAIAFLKSLEDLDIEFVEQPVAAADLEGMAACRGRGIAIAADESLNTPQDALALVRAKACDVMNVKVPKAGGLYQAKKVADLAAAEGMPLVIGGGLAFGISRFASLHLAFASPAAAGICHQGPGPASQALSDDITVPFLTPDWLRQSSRLANSVVGPGMGFEIDRNKLDHYRLS